MSPGAAVKTAVECMATPKKFYPVLDGIDLSSCPGVDPDSFVIGSECRRHKICRGDRGHAPWKILNFRLSEMPFPGF